MEEKNESEEERSERIRAEAKAEDDRRREERRLRDEQIMREGEARWKAEQEALKTKQPVQVEEKPQGRTLKAVKADLKQARKDYKASVLSHRALLGEQKRIISESLKVKLGYYNLVTQLRLEKKALKGAPKGD